MQCSFSKHVSQQILQSIVKLFNGFLVYFLSVLMIIKPQKILISKKLHEEFCPCISRSNNQCTQIEIRCLCFFLNIISFQFFENKNAFSGNIEKFCLGPKLKHRKIQIFNSITFLHWKWEISVIHEHPRMMDFKIPYFEVSFHNKFFHLGLIFNFTIKNKKKFHFNILVLHKLSVLILS